MKGFFVCFLAILTSSSSSDGRNIHTNEFVFQIEEKNLHSVLNSLSGSKLNLTLLKHIVSDFYLFAKTDYPKVNDEPIDSSFQREVKVALSEQVKFFRQEVMHKRGNYLQGNEIRGPSRIQRETVTERFLYKLLGVDQVWNKGYYGNNVTVAVVDCGVDMNHEDLQPNVVPHLSYDYIDWKEDANPPIDYQDSDYLDHGTNCAGLIAGIQGNHVCGDGIAPGASIASVRIFTVHGETTDATEAFALGHRLQDIDIYSNSWTTSDQVLYDGPAELTQTVLEIGVKQGRKGKGSIYIFPSGNGGKEENCNGDGYANSIYTITISCALINGRRPYYSEICPCALATTLSEGGSDPFSYLVTCNRTNNGRCSTVFQGSSVSTALASGIVALALDVNPKLTWRDVQHLIIKSSKPGILEKSGNWRRNGAHLSIHDALGFGFLNASEMIINAQNWTQVTKQNMCKIELDSPKFKMRKKKYMYIRFKDCCVNSSSKITRLEHVQLKLDLLAHNPNNLEILLKSPMMTVSRLMTKRPKKPLSSTSINWTYMSVQFWDENPAGKWTLKIKYGLHHKELITIKHVALILYGTTTDENDKDMKDSPMKVLIPWMIIALLVGLILPTAICYACYRQRNILRTFNQQNKQLQE